MCRVGDAICGTADIPGIVFVEPLDGVLTGSGDSEYFQGSNVDDLILPNGGDFNSVFGNGGNDIVEVAVETTTGQVLYNDMTPGDIIRLSENGCEVEVTYDMCLAELQIGVSYQIDTGVTIPNFDNIPATYGGLPHPYTINLFPSTTSSSNIGKICEWGDDCNCFEVPVECCLPPVTDCTG